jgi:ADP-ribosylglycohydrolase
MDLEIDFYIKGSIIGFLIGDVLGYPYENLDNLDQYYIEIIKTPEEDEVFGGWSFVGSSLLAVIDSIVEFEDIDFEDIKQKLSDIVCGGYLNPNAECKDFSETITQAVNNINNGMPFDKTGILVTDNISNESLFRVLPIALFCLNDSIEDFITNIHNVSLITHKNIESHIICALYGLIIKNIILQKNDKVTELLLDFYKTKKMNNFYTVTQEIINYKNNNTLSGKKEIKNSFWTAWNCFIKNENDYRQSVIKAVELGNDTNGTAALTGSFSGLSNGLNDIPKVWLSAIALDSYSMEIIQKFVDLVIQKNFVD